MSGCLYATYRHGSQLHTEGCVHELQTQLLLPCSHVQVVTVGNQKGLILLMDDTGRLSLVYLGTCPEHNPVAGAESTGEVDYAAMDQEHRQLLAKIRESARGQQQEYPGQLSIKAQASSLLQGQTVSGHPVLCAWHRAWSRCVDTGVLMLLPVECVLSASRAACTAGLHASASPVRMSVH